ncbi:hypothetical protein L873DRAFT_1260253 [Choiromyces venosus 120613-1]|uniref:Uncharacterized protein n=1 Tax=Choiromyces venosus 120613-1 TaxID=1336337 RepID=A0A3N4JH93_9PEZI|nr:hypothetical protein L873DRAFT_1260253 [Choiromyces venosus 120613-1]
MRKRALPTSHYTYSTLQYHCISIIIHSDSPVNHSLAPPSPPFLPSSVALLSTHTHTPLPKASFSNFGASPPVLCKHSHKVKIFIDTTGSPHVFRLHISIFKRSAFILFVKFRLNSERAIQPLLPSPPHSTGIATGFPKRTNLLFFFFRPSNFYNCFIFQLLC